MNSIACISVRRIIFCTVCFVCVVVTSCSTTKKVVYFNGLQDSSFTSVNGIPEPLIQSNDIISITVNSLNPDASIAFNVSNGNKKELSSEPANYQGGYLVSKSGYIQFPVLGELHVAGLTKEQLKDFLTRELVRQKLLVEPVIIIRFMNFKVTVLGEVAKPSVITIPNEKVTLLEAIGMAGDLTIYGRRDNVLLIREENNTKVTRRLNLNSPEVLQSPYYYLKSNDVVYVEPGKARTASSSRANYWLPVVVSSLTLVAIVMDQFID